jgi:tetratricopeptide (TPR) repeat protein
MPFRRPSVAVLALAMALGACGRPAGERGTLPYAVTAAMPPSAYEHYIRARIASERGDHELAIDELRMATASAGPRAELRVAIGEELFAAGQLAAARAEAEAATTRWPAEAAGWRLLGRVRAAQAAVRDAARAFERAVELELDEDTYLMLAAAYRQTNEDARAVATYERLVRALPSSAEGHFRLGRALAARQPALAAAHLGKAIDLDADHVDAWVALAEVHRRQGRIAEAAAVLRAALLRERAEPAVGERLFHVLLEQGDRPAAVGLLARLDGEGRAPSVRVRLGHFYLTLRLGDEALRIAEALLARDPAAQAARLLAARALAQLGRTADAVARCREVPAESSHFVAARALAGELLGKNGAPQEGLALVTQALAAWPDEPQLVVVLASLHEQLGALDRARGVLDAAMARAPGDEALIHARATLEERAQDPERAVAIMKKLLERDPDSVTALNFIGYSYADRNVELEASERLLRRAHELRPDDALVLDSLGWLHLRRGRVADARAALERAERLAPYEPEILYHLGELSLLGGEDARARQLYRDALALEPTHRLRARLEERLRTLEARAP